MLRPARRPPRHRLLFAQGRKKWNDALLRSCAAAEQKSACRNKNERTWKERGKRRERKKGEEKGVLDWAGNPRRRLLTLLMPLLIKLGHILELKGRDWIVHVYTGENKGSFVLISRTQAGPCRTVKQEQEEISRNHAQAFIPGSVEGANRVRILYADSIHARAICLRRARAQGSLRRLTPTVA